MCSWSLIISSDLSSAEKINLFKLYHLINILNATDWRVPFSVGKKDKNVQFLFNPSCRCIWLVCNFAQGKKYLFLRGQGLGTQAPLCCTTLQPEQQNNRFCIAGSWRHSMLTGTQVTIYWEDNGVSNSASGVGWSLLLLLSEQPGDFNGCALGQRRGHCFTGTAPSVAYPVVWHHRNQAFSSVVWQKRALTYATEDNKWRSLQNGIQEMTRKKVNT